MPLEHSAQNIKNDNTATNMLSHGCEIHQKQNILALLDEGNVEGANTLSRMHWRESPWQKKLAAFAYYLQTQQWCPALQDTSVQLDNQPIKITPIANKSTHCLCLLEQALASRQFTRALDLTSILIEVLLFEAVHKTFFHSWKVITGAPHITHTGKGQYDLRTTLPVLKSLISDETGNCLHIFSDTELKIDTGKRSRQHWLIALKNSDIESSIPTKLSKLNYSLDHEVTDINHPIKSTIERTLTPASLRNMIAHQWQIAEVQECIPKVLSSADLWESDVEHRQYVPVQDFQNIINKLYGRHNSTSLYTATLQSIKEAM